MKQEHRRIGILVVLPLLLTAVSLYYIGEADAYQQSGILEETKDVFYFRGDLTSSQDENPYGGDVVGKYFVMVNVDVVKVIADLDNQSFEGKVLEAWLVDFGGESMISLGTFEDNELNMSASMNEWIYEAIVISEVSDNSNSPENPVGGAALEKTSKHKSNKSF